LVRRTCYEHASESSLYGHVTSQEARSLGWKKKGKETKLDQPENLCFSGICVFRKGGVFTSEAVMEK